MRAESVSLEALGHYGGILMDYIQRKESLVNEGIWPHFADLNGLEKQLNYRKSTYTKKQREVLVAALIAQYQGIEISEAVKNNLDLLSQSTTFTVATGHQLCLFGGPAYLMLKIASTIRLAQELNKEFLASGHKVVPVFWMATDDHDIAEISKFRLFWQEYLWETNQSGPTGWLNTKGLEELLAGKPGSSILPYSQAYQSAETLAQANRKAINALFGDLGLLVLDPSVQALKACFEPEIREELTNNPTGKWVNAQSKKMAQLGYKPQIETKPINLFYQGKGFRERIIKKESDFETAEGKPLGNLEKVLSELQAFPERFSPNVCLRPLYQERLLPNLGVVLGPAEMHYWMQLKQVFDYFKQEVPVLIPRSFATFVSPPMVKKLDKLGIGVIDLFQEAMVLRDHWLAQNTESPIDNSEAYLLAIAEPLENLKQIATSLEAGLGQWAGAEKAAILQKAESMVSKIEKTWRKQHDDSLQLLQTIREKVLPLGKLQERKESVFTFLPANAEAMKALTQLCNPLEQDHKIIFTD